MVSRSLTPGTYRQSAPAARKRFARSIDSAREVGVREELAVGASGQDEVGAGRLARRGDAVDGQLHVVQLVAVVVLDVAAGQPGLARQGDRLRDLLGRSAVPVLEVTAHRYGDRRGDLLDALEHVLPGHARRAIGQRVIALGQRERDPRARRRDRRKPRCGQQNRTARIPGVRHHEPGRRLMQCTKSTSCSHRPTSHRQSRDSWADPRDGGRAHRMRWADPQRGGSAHQMGTT